MEAFQLVTDFVQNDFATETIGSIEHIIEKFEKFNIPFQFSGMIFLFVIVKKSKNTDLSLSLFMASSPLHLPLFLTSTDYILSSCFSAKKIMKNSIHIRSKLYSCTAKKRKKITRVQSKFLKKRQVKKKTYLQNY